MELRHLRYFVLVAEELHFGNAAKRAGIAQPPLSQQIQSLEAELGVRLFHRTRRRVELTDAGVALLPEARRLLRGAERAALAARDGAAGITGRLALGFVGSLAFGFMPAFARRQRQAAPSVRLDLRELTSEQQRASLCDGSIDLGLVRYPVIDDALISETLLREPLMVVMPDEPDTNDAGPLMISSLRDRPLVMFPRSYGPPFFDQIVGLCQAAGFSPRIEQEAIQMPTIVSLVAAGAGAAIVPASLEHLRLPGVRYRRLLAGDGTVPAAEVCLVRRGEERSEVVLRALDRIREVAGTVSPDPEPP